MKPVQIRVINLKRSSERRDVIRTQLDALELEYEFFPAVDGKADEHLRFANYSDEFCLKAWRRPMTSGEVGCFASHYLLWQRCVERNEPMIIMEDDVVISSRFGEAITLVAEKLEGIGYMRLAGINVPEFRDTRSDLPNDWRLVRFLKGPMGTQCYAVSPKAAARFLEHARKWVLPVDTYMDRFWIHDMSAMGLLPFPVERQMEIGSEIWVSGGSRALSTRDRVPKAKRVFVRLGDIALRQFYNARHRILDWAAS